MKKSNNRVKKKIQTETEMKRTGRKLEFATSFKIAMKDAGLTFKDLSQRTGKAERTLRRWLSGSADLKLLNMFMLADAIEQSLTIKLDVVQINRG